jgi:hypothetical protein
MLFVICSIITRKLKEMYQMITLGGDAELELVDSLDPFSEGIVFRCGGGGWGWAKLPSVARVAASQPLVHRPSPPPSSALYARRSCCTPHTSMVD